MNAAEHGYEWEFVGDVSFVLVPPHFKISDEEEKMNVTESLEVMGVPPKIQRDKGFFHYVDSPSSARFDDISTRSFPLFLQHFKIVLAPLPSTLAVTRAQP